ncbi:MAG: hypothetical protein PHP17_01620 [Candidatus Omnitrophica bacterium]|nr:hypothetical protein [Candidatus Omnitrophota bacterium]
MYCVVCKNSKTENKDEVLTLSAHAYEQVVSILKIHKSAAENKINEAGSSVSVCVKCLQRI